MDGSPTGLAEIITRELRSPGRLDERKEVQGDVRDANETHDRPAHVEDGVVAAV
jgi:hypothetical protein